MFNIAEGLQGVAREAQVPAILDLYQIPYTFSDPLVLALTLHKGLTKTLVRDAGLATADFALVERIEDVDRVDLPLPLFAKPVAEGTGKGVTAASKIRDRRRRSGAICAELLAKYRQPVLVETFLSGREFTVGIAGTGPEAEVLGSMEVALLPGAEANVYSYVNKEKCEELCRYLPTRPDEDEEVRPVGGVGPGRLPRPGLPRRRPGRCPLATAGGGRISSRSIPWPASTRCIPICPSSAECGESPILR